MEEKRNIDFKKHQLPKFKKWYLLKITFYVIVLIGLLIYLNYSLKKKQSKFPTVIEVNEFQIQN